MARNTLLVSAVLGLLVAGCSGGTFPRVGGPMPGSDSVQTVSDAADALDVHRTLASQSAKEAIGATMALGSFVRDLSARERDLAALRGQGGAGACGGTSAARTGRQGIVTRRTTYYFDAHCRSLALQVLRTSLTSGLGASTALQTTTFFAPGRTSPIAVRSDASQVWRWAVNTSGQLSTSGGSRFLSGSEIVIHPTLPSLSQFCLSSAGYSVAGIPSLDETFGWEDQTLSGGARTTDASGLSRWYATVAGNVVRGPIGAVTLSGGVVPPNCPMAGQAFSLGGAAAREAFSMRISALFENGRLGGVSVYDGKFADGVHLNVTTVTAHDVPYVDGAVERNGTQIAGFRIDPYGNGTLTITSTGAQYVITDWLVAGT